MKVNIFRELFVSLLVVLVISTIVLKGYTMESALKLLVANGEKYIAAAVILGTIFYVLIRRQKQQEEKEQEMKEMKMGDVASSEEIASVSQEGVCNADSEMRLEHADGRLQHLVLTFIDYGDAPEQRRPAVEIQEDP